MADDRARSANSAYRVNEAQEESPADYPSSVGNGKKVNADLNRTKVVAHVSRVGVNVGSTTWARRQSDSSLNPSSSQPFFFPTQNHTIIYCPGLFIVCISQELGSGWTVVLGEADLALCRRPRLQSLCNKSERIMLHGRCAHWWDTIARKALARRQSR